MPPVVGKLSGKEIRMTAPTPRSICRAGPDVLVHILPSSPNSISRVYDTRVGNLNSTNVSVTGSNRLIVSFPVPQIQTIPSLSTFKA